MTPRRVFHGEEEGVNRAAPLDGVPVFVEGAQEASLGRKHPAQSERDYLELGGPHHVGADGVLVGRAEEEQLGDLLLLGGQIGRRQASSLAAGLLLGGSGRLGSCSGHCGGGEGGGRNLGRTNLGRRRRIDAFDGNVWFVRCFVRVD